MDNKEIDKIIKEKLSGTIEPSKEFENRIKEHIKNQKQVFRQNTVRNDAKVKHKNRIFINMSKFISVAAVFVLVFAFGVLYKNQEGQPIIPIIPGAQESKKQTVTIKTIQPTKVQSGIIANDTEFLLQVEEDGTTVEDVQRSLYIEPALDYEITKTGSNEYKVKFKKNIPDNTIVKLQYIKNQITEDSWAYQTNNNLSVVETFPWNERDYVSEYTTIEVELSYANVENFVENVTITPNINGSWEHLGKIWRFTPNGALKTETYVVNINKDVRSDDKTLEKDYKFEFTVGKNDDRVDCYHDKLSIDDIENYSPSEQIKIFYYTSDKKSNINEIEISKFETVDDFIDYLQDDERNYDKARSLGNFEFEDIVLDNGPFIALKQNLPIGYYVASIKNANGREFFNCPIQISEIDAYVLETERDVMAWVAQNGELAKGIEVNYLNKIIKTDNNGIAKFEDITDGSTKIKYVKIGNGANKLVVGVNNFEQNKYPQGYLYTDRPLYKSTDTINIGGFIPRVLFYDEIDENEFYVRYNYDDSTKSRIKVEQDGTVKFKKELINNEDGYYSIQLLYKDKVIASEGVQIKNYELQNYNYEVNLNKNYAFNGENFEFDVKVTHVTGISVPNKNILVKYNDNSIRFKTDETGTAHISIKIFADSEYNGLGSRYIAIYNGDGEQYSDIVEDFDIYTIARDVYINSELVEDNYNITLYKLNGKIDHLDTVKDLFDVIYDTDIDIYLREGISARYLNGYYYNEYTKQNEPLYNWHYSETENLIATVKTEDGKISFDTNTIEMKDDTDEANYDYSLIFKVKDSNGKTVSDTKFISKKDHSTGSLGRGDSRYYLYRYSYEDKENRSSDEWGYAFNTKKYSIGDNINLKLIEKKDSSDEEIKNEGTLLRIVYKEDITKMDLITNDDLSYTFTKEDFPGTNITAVYFLNGKFYRMSSIYYDFNEENKKVDIEITSDKDEYKPGDKVTLTVKTTNQENPIKTSVNISVANEAVFNAAQDDEYSLDFLSTIYINKYFANYTYSSYQDYIEKNFRGGGGGGRRWRHQSKFRGHSLF